MKNETASRTWRYGTAEAPRPPSTRAFHASESQVERNANSTGYSHQSENSAPSRTMLEGNAGAYSASIASPIRLVTA